MSNSDQNPPFNTVDLSETWGCECALPYVTEPVTYYVVGRGALPQSTPTETYVRQKFDPHTKRSVDLK